MVSILGVNWHINPNSCASLVTFYFAINRLEKNTYFEGLIYYPSNSVSEAEPINMNLIYSEAREQVLKEESEQNESPVDVNNPKLAYLM